MDSGASNPGWSAFVLALSPTRSRMWWLVWLPVAALLCARAFHDQFEKVGEAFPNVAPVLLLALAALAIPAPILYRKVRGRGLWRYEVALLAALLAAVPLVYAPVAALAVAWMLAACYGVGRFCRERVGFKVESPVADIVFSSAIGVQLLVVALIILGLAGAYRTWVFLALLAMLSAVFHRQWFGLWESIRAIDARWRAQGQESSDSLVASLVFVFAVCLAVCALVVVLTPSTWPDPVQLHLPLARFYAESGALREMPPVSYGYHPQSFEILMAMAYSLAGQSAAQMIHPVLFGLALLAAYGVGRELGVPRTGAMVGTAFAAALPAIHFTGINMKNDLAVSLYQLAAFWAFLRWLSDGRFRWIYLGVYFAGTAWMFKHPAAIGIPGLALLFIYAAWKQPRRWRAFASCVVIFVCCSSFWMVRAYADHGDPFFPTDPLNPFARDETDPPEPKTLWEDYRRELLFPWFVHYHPDGYYRAEEDRSVGLAFLITAPLWFLVRRRSRRAVTLALVVYLTTHVVVWVVMPAAMRFLFTPLCVLAMLAGSRLEYWHGRGGRAVRTTLFGAAAVAMFFSMTVILVNEINIAQLELLAGRINRTEYLRRASFGYKTLEVLERQAGPTDQVIAVALFSRAYAPYPQNYYYRAFGEGAIPSDLVARVRPAFVIAPARPESDWQVRKAVPGAVVIHSTEQFRLYQVRRD